MTERRRSVRIEAEIHLRTVADDGETLLAYGGELSETGLFVEYVLPYAEGTRLRVDFQLPGSGQIQADAKVVSAKSFLPSDLSERPGNGLEFIALPDAQRERVRAFMAGALAG